MTTLQQLTAEAHSRFPEQHYVKVTYDLFNTKQRELRAGDVIYRERYGLRFYWEPKGGNYTPEDKESLAGFYTIPDFEDFEDMCLNEAYTPADDYVEPDHPDAWPRLLGFV
tara:strand:+ start:310 stop:642 length:333 start_codon:yes stop_codon:yes gene_type:complete